MKLQTSQGGKQYLKTARMLLRVAQTMTDEVVACQLKALTDEYESARRERVGLDAAKALTAHRLMRRQAIGR